MTGQRNDPSTVPRGVAAIARVKGISEEVKSFQKCTEMDRQNDSFFVALMHTGSKNGYTSELSEIISALILLITKVCMLLKQRRKLRSGNLPISVYVELFDEVHNVVECELAG